VGACLLPGLIWLDSATRWQGEAPDALISPPRDIIKGAAFLQFDIRDQSPGI